MLSFEFLKNPSQRGELNSQVENFKRVLTTRMTFNNQRPYGDIEILFHPAHDHHHFIAHVKVRPDLLPQDLLYVSKSYLSQLETAYDADLFERLEASLRDNATPEDCLTIIQTPVNERLLFLMHASAILSRHVREGQSTYSHTIAQEVTNTYISEMVAVGYTDRQARRILGNTSPYREWLYGEEYDAHERTAWRLYEATHCQDSTSLRIPAIDSKPTPYASRPLSTPEFTKAMPPQSSWYPFVKRALELLESHDITLVEGPRRIERFLRATLKSEPVDLLERQINLFLSARKDVETEFSDRYRGAHCSLPLPSLER
jgi:hypothetical protein